MWGNVFCINPHLKEEEGKMYSPSVTVRSKMDAACVGGDSEGLA